MLTSRERRYRKVMRQAQAALDKGYTLLLKAGNEGFTNGLFSGDHILYDDIMAFRHMLIDASKTIEFTLRRKIDD